MNRTQPNRINSNVKFLKRDYSTAQVKEQERDTRPLVRTREAKISNTKLNVYKTVLQKAWEKFNGAKQYVQWKR